MQLFSTEPTLRAVLELRLNSQFKLVVEEIARYTEELNKALIYCNEPDKRALLAGMVRSLSEILTGIGEAQIRFDNLMVKEN